MDWTGSIQGVQASMCECPAIWVRGNSLCKPLLPHAQAMDFLVDIWDIIKDFMTPREFAKICSTSHASYAVRQQLVATELCFGPGNYEQLLLGQLQLSKWPTCHSLCINLGQLHEAMEISQSQRDIIKEAGSTMASLHCLHLIGRKPVRFTESSIEGVLVSLLAKHAVVLTMQVETVIMPLELPNLQHLALDVQRTTRYWREDLHWALFGAIKVLRGLKTLYIQSRAALIQKPVDLTDCGHLRCMTVQGVNFMGSLALPDGCFLHANSHCWEPSVSNRRIWEVTAESACLLTGLTLRETESTWQAASWTRNWLRDGALCMRNLKRLRVILGYSGDFQMVFGPWLMPSLEVLELDAQSDMVLSMFPGLALKRLALITTGSLRFDEENLQQEQSAAPKLTELYLQSSAPFSQKHMMAILARYTAQPEPEVKLSDYVKNKQHRWIAQMPASFKSSNLQECYCSACPECLAKDGVSIRCDNTWTLNGFEKHLKPHIRESIRDTERSSEQLGMASHEDQRSRS